MDTVAWIGLGNMGLPMARNLTKTGARVVVYNRTSRQADLGQLELANSLADTVKDARIVFIMVSDGSAVREILFGEEGISRLLPSGSVIVNMSTIGVSETKEFALRLADAEIEFMDAPVSGSVQPATTGELVILAGGSDAAFNRVGPYFEALGKKTFHLGTVGSGAAMKLLVNSFLAMTLEASAECMALAEKSGLGKNEFLEVLSNTGMWSPLLTGKRDLWETGEYKAAFALKHMTKDLALTSDHARQLSVGMPATLATLSMFLTAEANGLAEQDMAAIAKQLAGMAGVE